MLYALILGCVVYLIALKLTMSVRGQRLAAYVVFRN